MMTELEKRENLSILAGTAKRANKHLEDTFELSNSEALAIWNLLFDHFFQEEQLHELVDDSK